MSLNNGGLLTYIDGINPSAFTVCYLAFTVITIFIAYLCGSVNSAIIISKVLHHDDIRKHGSGNAGLTNMLRTYGKGSAGLTLLGDVLKTGIAILVAGVLFGFNYVAGVSTGDGMCYVAGLFAVVGHIFPIYYKFKGGKGVLSTAVTVLILAPIPFAILFAIFVLIVATSKYVSLGSVTAAILFPVVLNAYFSIVFSNVDKSLPGLAAFSSIVIAILIVWCHRGNLQRISDRTERKISFKKKTEEKVEPVENSNESEE